MGTEISLVEPATRPFLDAAGLQSYHDFIRCLIGRVVAHSGTTLTRRLELSSDGKREIVYLKRYHYMGPRWRHRFREPKGWVEARNYKLLRDRCGLRVPDVIAVGSRRRGLRLLDAFLMTRAVEGAVPLDELLLGRAGTADQPALETTSAPPKPRIAFARQIALLHEIARCVSRMHAARFFHWDLQWRNILVRPAGNKFEIYFIDSSRGGLRRTPAGRVHGRIRDLFSLDKLARKHLTRTMRYRFLTAYMGDAPPRSAVRQMIKRLLAYVEKKSR